MHRKSQVSVKNSRTGSWIGVVRPSDTTEKIENITADVSEDDNLDEFLSGTVDSATGQINWVAGGMLVILNTADGVYIPVGWRDAGAPRHSEMLCTASGLADTVDELMNPRKIGYREALEEILLYDSDRNCWILPTDNSIGVSETDAAGELHSMWESTGSVPSDCGVERANATVHPFGDDQFTVHHPGDSSVSTVEGHYVFDSETRNADVVDALVVDIPDVSIEDLRLFDGEELGRDLLDRDVFLFTPSEFKGLFSGRSTALRAFTNGKFKTSSGLSDSFDEGEEVTRNFEGVPTLTQSHDELVSFLNSI